MITSILSAAVISMSCNFPIAKCVCYPAIPFEGFQIYVHEKCGDSEGSYRYGKFMYDSAEMCELAMSEDLNCQSLKE